MPLPPAPAGSDDLIAKLSDRPLVVVTIAKVAGAGTRPGWFKTARPVVVDDDPTWHGDGAEPQEPLRD